MLIRIEPDILREISGQHAEIVNSMRDVVAKLDNAKNQLADAWEGAAATEALDSLSEIRNNLKEVIENTDEGRGALTDIAEAFERLDIGTGFSFAIRTLLAAPLPRLIDILGLMYPGRVRIEPDRVREVAEQCKVLSEVIAENTNRLAQTLEVLRNNWEGRAFLKFEEEARTRIDAFNKNCENLNEFTSKIIRAANRYEEIDNSL